MALAITLLELKGVDLTKIVLEQGAELDARGRAALSEAMNY